MFNASTKQASWSTETSSLILGGNLGLTPVNRTDSRIKSQLSLSLETDVLSFTNYVYNFIQMSAPCGVTDLQNPQNEYSAFSNSICHNLSQPLQASDFNSLKSELAQIVDRIETDLKRFKVAIEEAQLRATDPEVLQGLDYMLVNTDENLAELQNIQVIESNDSLLISLDLSDFVTSMTQTSVATDKVLLNFELTATALHLSLDIDKTMNLQNYTPWIEDIKDHLALIAQGDPEARAQLGYFAQAYLEMAKHFLTIPMN